MGLAWPAGRVEEVLCMDDSEVLCFRNEGWHCSKGRSERQRHRAGYVRQELLWSLAV